MFEPQISPSRGLEHDPKPRLLPEVQKQPKGHDRHFQSPDTKSSEALPYPKLDIQLRFQVDPKTRELTIMVLDKAARRVLRTIPPEEMARLHAGELIEIFV
jgi:hypothetical protein